jgi:two-component system nitrogen regulation sensor histidine kinase GlnL
MLAHEIKNPLRGFAARRTSRSLGRRGPQPDPAHHEEADRIVKLSIVWKCSPTSGRSSASRSTSMWCSNVKRLAHSGFAPDQIRRGVRPSLPPVLANRDQLVQVFLNGQERRRGDRRARRRRDRAHHRVPARGALSVPATPAARVSLPLEFCVKDNGPGVPEDLLPHLFDPFVTTKPTGSGLGLALWPRSSAITADHRMRITSEHTTFRVRCPCT